MLYDASYGTAEEQDPKKKPQAQTQTQIPAVGGAVTQPVSAEPAPNVQTTTAQAPTALPAGFAPQPVAPAAPVAGVTQAPAINTTMAPAPTAPALDPAMQQYRTATLNESGTQRPFWEQLFAAQDAGTIGNSFNWGDLTPSMQSVIAETPMGMNLRSAWDATQQSLATVDPNEQSQMVGTQDPRITYGALMDDPAFAAQANKVMGLGANGEGSGSYSPWAGPGTGGLPGTNGGASAGYGAQFGGDTPSPMSTPAATALQQALQQATGRPMAQGAVGSGVSGPFVPGTGGNGVAMRAIDPASDLRGQEITPGQGPSRSDIARQRLAAFDTEAQPMIDKRIKQVGKRAASLGRLGMGQTSIEALEPYTDYLTNRAALSHRLAADTAEGEIGDQRSNRDEMRGERSWQEELARYALDQSIRQRMLENSEQSAEFGRGVQLANLGFGSSPWGSLLAGSQAAGQGTAGSFDLLMDWLARRGG
jgi:hypothetical protein